MKENCLNCLHCWYNPTDSLHGYWCDRDLPAEEEPWFGNMDFLGYEEFELADEMACFEAYHEAVR